jgi:hypothetical protein
MFLVACTGYFAQYICTSRQGLAKTRRTRLFLRPDSSYSMRNGIFVQNPTILEQRTRMMLAGSSPWSGARACHGHGVAPQRCTHYAVYNLLLDIGWLARRLLRSMRCSCLLATWSCSLSSLWPSRLKSQV